MGNKKNRLWFVLGRETKLSAAELISILEIAEFELDFGILKTHTNHGAKFLMSRLGGTIKIAEEIKVDLTEEKLLTTIVEELKTTTGKITFGLSFYTPTEEGKNLPMIQNWGKRIKKILKDEGRQVRYVENREVVLSSATVEKNGLTKRGTEFLIEQLDSLDGGKKYSFAKTAEVQPFEDWSKRDFGRPARDDRNGMLPPKLAAILINLAIGKISENDQGIFEPEEAFTLLDPFCGSGTVLTEAMHLGIPKIIGTDLSDKCISDSKINIEWVKNNFSNNSKNNISIFQTDVRDLSKKINANSVDIIASEPTMGKPLRGHEKKHELEIQAKELRELFIKAFGEFYKILKPGGKIVFVIPRFRFGKEWIRIDCVGAIQKMGFKILPLLPNEEFVLYARPNQHVGREIWRFSK